MIIFLCQVVCAFVAIVAVFVMAIPAGLLGKGFEMAGDEIMEEMEAKQKALDEIAASADPVYLPLPSSSDVSVQANAYRLFWCDEYLQGDCVNVSVDAALQKRHAAALGVELAEYLEGSSSGNGEELEGSLESLYTSSFYDD